MRRVGTYEARSVIVIFRLRLCPQVHSVRFLKYVLLSGIIKAGDIQVVMRVV